MNDELICGIFALINAPEDIINMIYENAIKNNFTAKEAVYDYLTKRLKANKHISETDSDY